MTIRVVVADDHDGGAGDLLAERPLGGTDRIVRHDDRLVSRDPDR